MNKKKIIDIEDNIEFRSTHELHFYWYIKELYNNKFIKNYITERDITPYQLSENTKIPFINNYNKNNKEDQFTLVQQTTYTPDFFFIWTSKSKDIFIQYHHDLNLNKNLINVNAMNLPFTCIVGEDQKVFSVIDVKNPFNKGGTRTKFSLLGKWVWDKYRIYVQEIHTEKLFAQTFTPRRYLYTDNDLSRKRTINNFIVRSLKDYINIRCK